MIDIGGTPSCIFQKNNLDNALENGLNIGDLIMQYHAGEMIFLQSVEELQLSMIKLATIWKNDEDFSIICKNAIKMVKDNFNWKKVILEFNDKLYKL